MTLPRTIRVLPIAVASGALLAASLTATATTSSAEESASTTASWVTTSEDDVPTATFTAVVPYDRPALRRLARQVSRPDGRRFRQFLTLEQAAAQVGATRKARRDLRERARELGIEVAFDGTGLTAQLTAPLDTWVDIYGTKLELTDAAPKAMSVFVPNATKTSYEPDVPLVLRGVVQKIFPIDTEVVPQTVPAAIEPPINEGTPFGPGADCILEGNRDFMYSPNQLHVPYGTTALHEQGISGEGARLGVIGIGQVFDPGLAEVAGECFDYEVPRLDVVGAPGIGDLPVIAGPTIGVESNLDVQVSTAVLPDAPAVAFVETVGSLSFMQNLIQGYTTALTVLDPDALTLSYGECVSELKESGDWQSWERPCSSPLAIRDPAAACTVGEPMRRSRPTTPPHPHGRQPSGERASSWARAIDGSARSCGTPPPGIRSFRPAVVARLLPIPRRGISGRSARPIGDSFPMSWRMPRSARAGRW